MRPRGPSREIHRKSAPVSAVGFQRDLYTISSGITPHDAQWLEMQFFQQIDDRAAVAVAKLENRQPMTGSDRIGFCQFILSMLHRTAARLSFFRAEVSRRMGGAIEVGNEEHSQMVREAALQTMASLISLKDSVRRLFEADRKRSWVISVRCDSVVFARQ